MGLIGLKAEWGNGGWLRWINLLYKRSVSKRKQREGEAKIKPRVQLSDLRYSLP
jgi:hypothetical protein